MPNYEVVFEVTARHVVRCNHENATMAIEDAKEIVKRHVEGEVVEFKLKHIKDVDKIVESGIGGQGIGGSGRGPGG